MAANSEVPLGFMVWHSESSWVGSPATSTSTLCFVTTGGNSEPRKLRLTANWRPTDGDAAGEGCRLIGAAEGRHSGFDANVKLRKEQRWGQGQINGQSC